VFRPYVSVARTPGVALPFFASFLGSLPIGMLGLGVLLLVQSTTGSFIHAGAVSGALSAGNAVGLLVQGRLLDRYGQARVLTTTGLLCGSSLLLLTLVAARGGHLLLVGALAAIAGASIPAVITSMRVLIPRLIAAAEARRAAYALLGMSFQVAMIAGPLAVTAVLAVSRPHIVVLGAAVLASGASLLFAATPSARREGAAPPATVLPPRHDRGTIRSVRTPGRSPGRSLGLALGLTPGLRTILVAAFASGLAAGLETVAVPAVAVAHGAASVAGVLFAAASLGDLVGGFLYGGRRWRMPLRAQLVCCYSASSLGIGVLAVLAGAPYAMVPVMFAGGVVHAPGGIATSALLDDVARKGALAQSYTAMVAAGLVGIAVGSAVAGVLDDLTSVRVLFATSAVVMAGVAVWIHVRRRTLVPDNRDER
jgi:MFS family permease